ncbi:MAG: hypothetical protein ACFFB5_18670 [Promethearchaeota archaeon]
MKRCTKCILPVTYPKITFNEEGVCNHCINHKKLNYLGDEACREEIEKFHKIKKDRNQDYDCIIGYSGGKDSAYLLYYLTKVINLRVLAYSIEADFIPEQALKNRDVGTDILNVKLVIEKNEYLKRCFKHTMSTWMKRPTVEMVESFCTGCRLTPIMVFRYAKKKKIPVVVMGGEPFEHPEYKFLLFSKKNYIKNVIRNPRWVLNYTYFSTQFKEYFYFFYEKKLVKRYGLLKVRPFFDYTRWVEKDVISTIKKELNWKKNPLLESFWRADCNIAQLKLYIYKKVLGFNDKVDNLSILTRDNQISREVALERLEVEEFVPEEIIKSLFDEVDLDYSKFEEALIKAQERYYKKNRKL